MTYQALKAWAQERLREREKLPAISLSLGSCSLAVGANEVLQAMEEALAREGLEARVRQTGCPGLCHHEVLVTAALPGLPPITYGHITPPLAQELVIALLKDNDLRPDLALAAQEPWEGIPSWAELPYWAAQERVVLANCGQIDPSSLEEYLARDGYEGLARALEMAPPEVTAQVSASGLQGRGGAGFPTGKKWEFCRQAPGEVRYLICNADESEPGTFKDRLIMEGDPHRVIEGIAIAAYAIGAQEAYIYIRGEYPLAAERLEVAIGQAHEAGLLGERVLGSGFKLDIHLHRGAGAYICGEETALIESLEGKRGVPRVRPPYPPSYGLWGKPTVVNNVETLANLPEIVRLGADWYRERGTEGSPGTKVYIILGDVRRPMAFEAPLGLSAAEAVERYGGGTFQDRMLHVAQTGGSAGNIVPAERLGVPLDYASAKNGVSLGSGAMLIGHSQRKAMDFLAPVVNFFRVESCGQCTPCREGLVRAQEILGRLASSEGVERDLLLLDILAEALCDGSFCGLGMAAATPLKDGLSHFREELLNGEGSLEFLGLRLTPKIKGQGLDERARGEVEEVLARRSKEREAIVDTLREINGCLGYLPPEALQLVGEAYRMEPSLVYGLASFYSLLSVAPRGKHVVCLCNSAPCYLGGEGQVMEAVKEALGLEVGETTADGLFTLETTSCLGLCAVGPVMSVDEKVYGRLTPERAVEMLEGIKGQESHAGRGHK